MTNVSSDIGKYTGLSSDESAAVLAKSFEMQNPDSHYIYCFSFDRDGSECWYVGETQNLEERIKTHSRQKDVQSIELVECTDNRKEARERERELSYEVAIEKNSTKIYGGR